jgi:cell fate regulator YaaT (PSP1 superfamily)
MQTVKVRLRKPTRVFTFLSRDLPLDRNDHCIVQSDRGLEFGTCVLSPEPCPETAKDRYKMTVVRKVTPNDEATFLQIQQDEVRAKEICIQRIHDRNLPMKLVDVEYTFDKRKCVFYFTAAERVDFRTLVRDLAQQLRTRIELRHIQVRDEAKLVGGIGVCGRELCCSTWLREFKPISMRMAKRQNLSLNPGKISGQCGRLLCCLSYENELYHERKREEMEAIDIAPDADEEAWEQDAFGREGAFSESRVRHRPADWAERLREMDEASGETLEVLDDRADQHSAVVDIEESPPEPAPESAPGSPRASTPELAAASPTDFQERPRLEPIGAPPDRGPRHSRHKRRRRRQRGMDRRDDGKPSPN